MLHGCSEAVHDGDRIGIATLHSRSEIHRMLSVDMHDLDLKLTAIDSMADILDEKRCLADRAQRKAVHIRRRRHLAAGVDVVVLRTNAHIAGRQDFRTR